MNSEPEQHTRRTVLVILGGAAAGLGFSSALPAGTPGTSPLPPGVNLPSSNHLGHALMSSGRFHPIPAGCPTDYVRPRTGRFTPQFFSNAEFPVIGRLVQLMLGEPSPSGAEGSRTAQEVAEWIDLRVASGSGVRNAARNLDPLNRSLAVAYFGAAKVTELETADPETICHDGLAWLTEAARDRGSGQFLSLPEQQQVDILNGISDERPDLKTENSGTRFFTFLKEETVRGYYTSRAGLKELDFKGNAFYARSPGCNSKPTQLT